MTNLLIKSKKNEHDYEYQKIWNKVHELNEIQQNLINCIEEQDNTLDNIENNLDSTLEVVDESNQDLKIAEQYYFKYTPIIIGSALGAVIAGPIGVATHLKFTSILTLGGTLVGGMLGYKVQKI